MALLEVIDVSNLHPVSYLRAQGDLNERDNPPAAMSISNHLKQIELKDDACPCSVM